MKEENRKFIERFTLVVRIQHIILFVSSLVLAVTGAALLWHSTDIGKFIINMGGGYESRALIHRVSAIVLIVDGIWHLAYIFFIRKAHEDFLKVIPRLSDFTNFARTISYYLSGKKEFPKFGKFNFVQKFQYWGVVAGMIVMIVSGTVLWFKDISMIILPKWAMDVFLTLHGSEGLLAFVVLLVWHQYNVHFNPSIFPMDKTWLTGMMDPERMKKEHYLEYEKITKKTA